MLERFDKGNAGILAAAAAVRSPLIIGFRLERNAEPLNTCRITSFVEFYAGNADARKISTRDKSREQVKSAVRAASGSRIQDTFYFHRIARIRLHYQTQTLQLKAAHRLFSL
jgi:hypothetical protein